MKLLIISNVWIEPDSSAAGSRMLQLIGLFRDHNFEIMYACTAGRSEFALDLGTLGIQTAAVRMNDGSFDAFAKAYQPTIVLFDRFKVEEQFGWRIAESCPTTMRILDTEDLHCLRKSREVAIKENRPFAENDLLSDIAKREIASIYRCDLTLMISDYEMQLLQEFFKVPPALLSYIPFLLPKLETDFEPYEAREQFVAMGNFLHAPNWDATLQLKNHIWPLIRKELPKVALHIYGAYPSEKVWQLHNPKEGFCVKGRAENSQKVISQARVLLAPLRFGAGLKGKFIDAMQCGTPSITTKIGAEGMNGDLDWCGAVCEDNHAFAKAATSLYTSQSDWGLSQRNGIAIINERFQKTDYANEFMACIKELSENMTAHRAKNFTGQMLQHHTARSTKFMAKWIEEKNSKS